jgi:hypothetical protein
MLPFFSRAIKVIWKLTEENTVSVKKYFGVR